MNMYQHVISPFSFLFFDIEMTPATLLCMTYSSQLFITATTLYDIMH